MNKIVKIIGGFFILLSIYSCSASWHLQKAIQKDPSILKTDTVTINIPDIQIDTVFENSIDTVKVSEDIDSIIASLNLPEICKEVIKPITKYITTISFIDTTINLVDTFYTDSFKVIIQTSLNPLENNTYSLTTSLKDIQVTYSEDTYIQKDTSLLNKLEEIILLAILFILAILLVKSRF